MNGIEVKNLRVDYKEFSLKDIDLSIPKGTVMGLIGRNGAGKSTLIKCIAGCCSHSGDIRINGISAEENRVAYFSDLSVVFDELIYNDQMKVKNMPSMLAKVYPNFDKEFYNTYLKLFRINPKLSISKLSFGTRKKYQLITVMAARPKVLVLDEPTTGVDPSDRAEIIDIIQDFMMNEEHTVLLSTHITSDLDKIADYITLIDDGKIIISESTDNLQDRFRIIRADKNALSIGDEAVLHGVRVNAFGVEAVTDNRDIWERPGVTAAIPTLEEIMIAFTEREGKR